MNKTNVKQRFIKLVAVAALGLGLVALPLGLQGVAAAQSDAPASVSDCNRWRSYPQNFDRKADCVAFVQSNADNNGYGGNGGGNGESISELIKRVVKFITGLIQTLAAFIGRLF